MILTLSAALFEGMTYVERTNFWALIYALVGSPIPHALLLDTAEDVSARRGPVAAWLAPELPHHQDAVRALLMSGPMVAAAMSGGGLLAREGCWRRAGPLSVTVERVAASDWLTLRLTLTDALALVQEPLHLILENGRNDLSFLKYVARSDQRARLKQIEEAPAAIVVQGAGSGEIAAKLKPIAERPALSAVELRRLWKTWVMFDKDAGLDDATEPGVESSRLVGLCEEIHTKHGVPLSWICLQRREIESYIPDEGLPTDRNHQDASRWVEETRQSESTKEWAWAYDMKGGLVGDLYSGVKKARRQLFNERKEVPRPDELKRPFNALDDGTRRVLANGFRKAILNGALNHPTPPDWLELLGEEYDRGPTHQLPREALIQSIFDRM